MSATKAVVRESRSRDLDELEAYRASYHEYVAPLGELSDEDLNEPDRFSGLSQRIPGCGP